MVEIIGSFNYVKQKRKLDDKRCKVGSILHVAGMGWYSVSRLNTSHVWMAINGDAVPLSRDMLRRRTIDFVEETLT